MVLQTALPFAYLLSRGWKMRSNICFDSQSLQNKVKHRTETTCKRKGKANIIQLSTPIFDPFAYIHCSITWQNSISSLSIKVSLIREVIHVYGFITNWRWVPVWNQRNKTPVAAAAGVAFWMWLIQYFICADTFHSQSLGCCQNKSIKL